MTILWSTTNNNMDKSEQNLIENTILEKIDEFIDEEDGTNLGFLINDKMVLAVYSNRKIFIIKVLAHTKFIL